MQTAIPTDVKRSLARFCRWIYIRALTLGVGLAVMLVLSVAGPPTAARAEGLGAASADARHVPPRPTRAHASARRMRVPGTGQFGGLTSKDWPVVIRVSRRGDRVRQAVAAIEYTCASGGSFAVSDEWRDLPIRRQRFAATAVDSSADGGFLFETTSTITGRMTRSAKRISGTLRNRVVQRTVLGATVDTCDTGPLRFTVRR